VRRALFSFSPLLPLSVAPFPAGKPERFPARSFVSFGGFVAVSFVRFVCLGSFVCFGKAARPPPPPVCLALPPPVSLLLPGPPPPPPVCLAPITP